jgi:hypothetical protein
MKKPALVVLVVIVVAVVAAFIYSRMPPTLDLVPNHPDRNWNSGKVLHILPTVNHQRMLIKVSFMEPLPKPPVLTIPGTGARVVGVRTDSQGSFWRFDVSGLHPKTEYKLALHDAEGHELCDPWPLATFPSPDRAVQRFRLLIYTGLGGHDAHIEWFGTGPLPLPTRIKLLNKALSLKPDALVSSGDQIYYDLQYDKSARVMGSAPRSIAYAGTFDRSKPVLGTANEDVLKKAVGPQIAYLYGTACRSMPTFFLLDDHDYFENDIATKDAWGFEIKLLLLAIRSPWFKGGVSFPPDRFMLDLAASAQKLYMPEFLPDPTRPADLPATNTPDRAAGAGECYGTLRYGTLFEGLLYEGRRFVTLTGKDAVVFPTSVEAWLKARMAAQDTEFVVHLPAIEYGWSAGKWMEWYPDVRSDAGKLTTAEPKYAWQPGWFNQHNRILSAASAMDHTIPLFICGDMHSQAILKIVESGDVNLSANPVISVLSGSLGTGPRGWPSKFRGVAAEPASAIKGKEILSCVEKNGFVIADFTPDKVVIQFYAWRPPEPEAGIDDLKPYYTFELSNPPGM